jgi:protein-disulfide isomerase
MHQNAQIAAEAAQCARAQGKFWEYHDKLFANQQALGKDQLKQYAKDLGLNSADFDSCVDTGKFKELVAEDVKDGSKAGVSGTPAFFVNGRFVNGAASLETFTGIIDEELTAKGLPVPASK